jgi:hypothetical protein
MKKKRQNRGEQMKHKLAIMKSIIHLKAAQFSWQQAAFAVDVVVSVCMSICVLVTPPITITILFTCKNTRVFFPRRFRRSHNFSTNRSFCIVLSIRTLSPPFPGKKIISRHHIVCQT